MATCASASVPISTNAKPRPWPVNLSRGTNTDATEPACANSCSISDSCTWYERLPTYNLRPTVTLLTRALDSRRLDPTPLPGRKRPESGLILALVLSSGRERNTSAHQHVKDEIAQLFRRVLVPFNVGDQTALAVDYRGVQRVVHQPFVEVGL